MTADELLSHAHWMRRLAASLVADGEADDFVQETWRIALEAPTQSQQPSNLRAWLGSVLRNLVRKDRRDRSIRGWHEEHAAKREAVDSRVEERVELQRRVAQAVYALAEPYRSAIVLRYFDELAPREIAERQSISYDTARQRLSRGLAMLRAELDRDYEGGRDAWSAVCIAVAKKSSLASTSTALATGGAIVSAKLASGLAVVALIAAAGWWWSAQSSSPASPDAHARVAQPTAELAEVAKASERKAHPSTAPSRESVVLAAADAASFHRAIDRDRDLHGVVLDPNGKPIVGAKLEALRAEFSEINMLDLEHAHDRVSVATTSSDENGEFTIALPQGRPCDLDVSANGFASASIGRCHAGERVDVHLGPSASVFGRVTRSEDGSVVVGARVDLVLRSVEHVSSRAGPTAQTDLQGRFRFAGLAAGEYMLEVYPAHDQGTYGTLMLPAGGELERNFQVGGGYKVAGRVLDAETNEPIADAQVACDWTFTQFVRTDTRGEFVFDGFPTNEYQLHVRARGYGASEPKLCSPGAKPPERVELRMQRAHVAVGRLVDELGQPVEGAYVAATAYTTTESVVEDTGQAEQNDQLEWVSSRSSADGRFRLDPLRGDIRHTLFARKDGFGVVAYEFPTRETDEPMLDLGDVVLRGGAILRGRVVDDQGAAIAGQRVALEGSNADRGLWATVDNAPIDTSIARRGTNTDDLGRFSFADLAPGSYRALILNAESREVASASVSVTKGAAVKDVKLVVARGLSISGRVVDEEEHPIVANIRAETFDRRFESSSSARSSSDGTFEVKGLKPGDFQLTVDPDSLWFGEAGRVRHGRAIVASVAAGTRDVVVRVARVATIKGRVLDANGSPLALVEVRALEHGSDRDLYNVMTNKDGRFELLVGEKALVDLYAVQLLATAYPGQWNSSDQHFMRLSNVALGGDELELRLP